MKEKELRKLGRLELLELLLEVTKENDELKAQIDKLKTENEIAKGIDDIHGTAKQLGEVLDNAKHLGGAVEAAKQLGEVLDNAKHLGGAVEAARQLETALEAVNLFINDLKNIKVPDPSERPASEAEPKLSPAEKRKRMSDRNLYYRILDYFTKEPDLLDEFPEDLRVDIINKLLSILEG